jgi:NADH-quinone oxidoreductase subunit J
MVSILFGLLLMLMLISATLVIFAKNPVHSVLLLIFTFFNAAGVMIMIGAEYIAMITIIVYVGAVVILFLFVVMMLNINLSGATKGFAKTLPIISVFVMVFLGVFYFGLMKSKINLPDVFAESEHTLSLFHNSANYIGQTLYTDYILEFQLAGIILFLAMIGSITLVYRKTDRIVRRQNITQQIMRTKKDTIELVDVVSKSGVEI